MTVTFNVYVRENVSDPKTIVATGLTSQSYSVTGLTKGKKYLFSVGAEKNSVEKVGDEKVMLFGEAWTPAILTNAAKAWLDAENVELDGANRVSRMIDISGNNNHFAQSNNTYKPLKTNGLIRFDGIDDALNCSNLALFKNISNAWVFSVFKKRSSNISVGGSCVFYVSASSSATNRFNLLAKRANTGLLSFAARSGTTDATSVISSAVNYDGQFVLAYAEAKYSSGSTKLRINAFDDATGVVTAQNTSNNDAHLVVLGSGEATTSSADIDLYCHIVGIGSTPTLSEIQKLEGWAAHKYGLIDNLPVDHPYKTLIPTK